MSKITVGTISHGTLRTADLLQSFAAELERHTDESNASNRTLALTVDAQFRAEAIENGSDETEADSDLVTELQDALDALAPSGMYFGNTEGDGSDFGFWLNENGRKAALAQEFAAAFETRTRDNGDSFTCLKDGAAEWMRDAIHEAHGDMLPNDWSYRIARECADAIADVLADDCDADPTDSDIAWERVDGLIPVYNGERLSWLASHLERVGYCDEATEEMGADQMGILERVGLGMMEEYRNVWSTIAAAIESAAE